jgi:hypothetical protein
MREFYLMATLLVRTPEVADAEKLAIANVERAWQHNEKSLGRGEQEGQHKASGEVRSRARKGKPGQKKQPQRGLGVAQLEKLRLQEQSKQEAACLASLQSLPSMGFTDQNQNGAMYLRHMKGAISHHHANGRHGSALAFGNGRLGPPDKLAEYLGREGHRHVGKGSMDGDAFRTFMSLASTDHSRSVSLSRHERDHSVSIMLPRRKDDSEMSFICSNYPQAVTLGNNVHPSPSSVNNPGTEGSPTSSPASSALAYVASPPNSSVRESSFFSSALVSRASSANSHPSNAEIGDEKRSSAEVDMPHKSVLHGFSPVSNKGVMEVGMINTKLFPVIMTAGAGGAPIFAVTNLQCFESSSGPAIVDRLPQESTNVPLVVRASPLSVAFQ